MELDSKPISYATVTLQQHQTTQSTITLSITEPRQPRSSPPSKNIHHREVSQGGLEEISNEIRNDQNIDPLPTLTGKIPEGRRAPSGPTPGEYGQIRMTGILKEKSSQSNARSESPLTVSPPALGPMEEASLRRKTS